MENNTGNKNPKNSISRIIGSILVITLCAIPKIVYDVYQERKEIEYISEKSNLTDERYKNDIQNYITDTYYDGAEIDRFRFVDENTDNRKKTVECQVEFWIEDTLVMGNFTLTYINIADRFEYGNCTADLLNASVITPGAEDSVFCKRPFGVGQIENAVYRNEYAGFAFDLNGNWIIASDENLQKLEETSEGMFDGTMLGEVITNYEQFYDLQAENIDDMTTINVLYTKQPLLNYLNFLTLNEEDIVDAVIHYNQGMLEEVYNQSGISISSIDKEKVMFLGEERYALRTVGKLYDIPMFSIQLMDYHSGQYSVTLTVTSYYTDNVEGMLEMFYKADN